MALGPNYAQLHRRAAWFVDRILRGAKPADLPVEQPTQFDFVLNFKAAAAVGMSIPQSVLLQATDVVR
jgi:putative tryptophan/tyrosine transport system substrate-binding protein